jgi:hypothetical protein
MLNSPRPAARKGSKNFFITESKVKNKLSASRRQS